MTHTPEQQLIAACLSNPDLIRTASEYTSGVEFTDHRYEQAWELMVKAKDAKRPLDLTTFHLAVVDAGIRGIEATDPWSWQEQVWSVSELTVQRLAEVIHDGYMQREIARIVTENRPGETPVGDALSRMIEGLTGIRKHSTRSILDGKDLGDLLNVSGDYDWLVDGLMERGDRLMLTGGEGAGKALALDTPIPTPNGWTTMGDLNVGDYVFDADGNPTRVVNATGTMLDRSCYRVTFSDGSEIIADADHLWETEDYAARRSTARNGTRGDLKPRGTDQRHKMPRAAVRTTQEIRDTLWARGGHTLNHSIEVTKPLSYPTQDQPVPAWLLGLWLGDGATAAGRITIGAEDLEATQSLIEAEGYNMRTDVVGISYTVRGLAVQLREMGALGRKHIPSEYLHGDVTQRLALLQGLMDSDGTVSTGGAVNGRGSGASKCEFSICDEVLAREVHELVIGLGMKSTFREGPAKINGRTVGTRYRISFQTDLPVFRLPRKLARLTPLRTRRAKLRYITSVEPVESVPVRCIQVDNPRKLYLAGRECIPTHNTTFARQMAVCLAAGVHPFKLTEVTPLRVLVIDAENSERQWKRAASEMVDAVLHSRPQADPRTNMHVVCSARLDVTRESHIGAVHRKIDEFEPDLVLIGPLYKITSGAINNDDDAAPLLAALDSIRDRGLAMVIEAHAGKGTNSLGDRNLAPRGSSALLGWPEFGVGLRLDENNTDNWTRVVELSRWRGDRDVRDWPMKLTSAGPLAWNDEDADPNMRRKFYQ